MAWCVFRPWNYINGPTYDGADIADEGLPPSHLLKPSYGLKPAWKDSVEERSAPEPAPVAPTTKNAKHNKRTPRVFEMARYARL
ncbi:hypothetical protein NOF04DRAFT_17009 [Fusarium oxysporum II5]|uniref:Uncharacterized protein n=1 Tax=Fusarium odoratissimum (strain NRRL 54006) TaxID=1089451 RepID=X0L9K8_FUSO5|nr:uncharacterized protein FOIG_04087 [Fusarium odoratissimum NRRL 54006]EXM05525.1 hypothetical protein FOIG_04087 [Fusarium odoratissimum NRRL 54006]KAK2126129.1 hypothetical protein NOF04DRAFT_17009 [Fusarium oxysporum II5]